MARNLEARLDVVGAPSIHPRAEARKTQLERRGRLLWLLGYGLLLIAWVGGNPPGSAPDEPQHHIKAVGVAYGQPVGKVAAPVGTFPYEQDQFLRHVTRSVSIPARLAPFGWACNAFQPTVSAACYDSASSTVSAPGARVTERTALGTYTPIPYIPFGLAARLAGTAEAALYAERGVAATLCLALIGLALALSTSAWSRLALLVAVTPSMVFMSSVITTSGLEISAALAHGAAVLAMARTRDRRLWWPYALSGSVLVLTRPLGPLWIFLGALLLVMLVRPRPLWRWAMSAKKVAIPAITALATATGVASFWTMAVMPSDHASLSVARSFLSSSLEYLPNVLRQSLAAFGWQNVVPPNGVLILGLGLYGVVILLGLLRARPFDRAVLVISLVGTFGLALYLSAFTQQPFGFFLQARYVMPASAVVLLLAGRAADGREAISRVARGLQVVVVLSVAFLQWISWFVNARRSAVGQPGPLFFLRHPEWTPPAGWWPWLALASIGCILVAAGALRSILAPASAQKRHEIQTRVQYPQLATE